MKVQTRRVLSKRLISLISVVAIVTTASDAMALYARPQLENTPIDRLVDNLTKQVEATPKDAKLRHNLARVHAMAYASKSETAQTTSRADKTSVWFGYEPRPVPFANKPTEDEEKLKIAKAHLEKAIARYKEVLKIDPSDLIARLGYGWCLDQAGRNMQAIDEYRKVIEMGWNKEKEMKFAPLGWHSVVAEAQKYLKPHLDAKADREEIARNDERIAKLRGIPRPVTPIAIPLADDLSIDDVEDRSTSVLFDADGTGEIKRWSWITPKAAWLVYDRRGTGQVTSALQMFGNVSFWCFWDNGYQALAALDNNNDGNLSGTELDGLALWHDENSNGISDSGEVRQLAEFKIVALCCRWQKDDSHPDEIAFSPLGVTLAGGTTRPSFDIVLHPSKEEN